MFDLYQAITDRIIAEMEKGIIPWRKPWIAAGCCVSHTTGKSYSLLNQMLLGRPGEYLTYNECAKEGGNVRKGEKGHMIVFWKFVKQEDKETGEEKEVPFLRYYTVFHIDQCEGIHAKYTDRTAQPVSADETADSIITDYITREGITLTYTEGDAAYYQPSTDRIVIPMREQFKDTAELYSTIFHEMTHSTGHPKRLDRIAATAFFGTQDYSKEELVAEIGAAALVNHVGLETDKSLRNSAAYIQNWLQVLKDDKRFIISASGKAEKAVALILGNT